MWGDELTGKFARTGVEHLGRVGDIIVPVLSDNLLLCEVRVTYF